MAVIQRKVSFYRLSLEKDVLVRERRTVQVHPLSNEEMEEQFDFIYSEKMADISNGRKAMDVETYNSNYVVEVISYSNHRVFLKIGQQNSANTVALRDRNTLESEDVPMRDSQLLELFTFCLIDFETGIVSYIGINGAPRISAVRKMFDNSLLKERNIHATLAAILTEDILDYLLGKSIIGGITVKVAVPSDEVLSDKGESAMTFDALRNVKTSTATYNITGKRNKSIFATSSKLAKWIADLKLKYGDNIQALSVRAKDKGEKSQVYDLLQYNFTKTVSMGDADSSTLGVNDFKEALINTYEKYKDELLRYSRI